jgi:hypothetical protein
VDLLTSVVELIVRTMDGARPGVFIVLSVLWSPPLVLAHELAHACTAVALTRRPARVTRPWS